MIRTALISLAAALAIVVTLLLSGPGSAGANQALTVTDGSATNANGTSGPPVLTVAPTLNRTGTVGVGTRLSCTDGTWANDPDRFRIRWRRNRVLVHTGATYTVTRADAGARIGCYVAAANEQGTTIATGGSVRVTLTRPRTTRPR